MAADLSPLERFLREYVEVMEGAWEEVEPQIYDVLLPTEVVQGLGESAPFPAKETMLRVAFDPEAIPEHPGSHLLIYGSPLLERIFAHARKQSRISRIFLPGVNLAAHEIEAQVRGGLEVPEGSVWKIGQVRPFFFFHAAFWFQATFVSDEKEQENYLNVVDLFYGRFARHLEEMLLRREFFNGTSERRPFPWPDARRLPLAQAYLRARERVVGTAMAAARTHRREQEQRLEQQVERLGRYYRDLGKELEERLEKARRDGRMRPETLRSLEERRAGLAQEEQVRVAELRQRTRLRMHLRLLNLLLIAYPKFRIPVFLALKKGPSVELELVWDPLIGQLEPPSCPACGRPTRRLEVLNRGGLGCPECWPGEMEQETARGRRGEGKPSRHNRQADGSW
jgi:hypothetical protein